MYSAIRNQLEACWSEIPLTDRPRVLLGLLRSKQDVQHERARDVLFAGTTLARLGWQVGWEPSGSDGKTPDFLLRKDGLEVLAEAVTPEVDGPLPASKDTQRFRDAIASIESEYGIWVSDLVFTREADHEAARQHFVDAMATAREDELEQMLGEYTAAGANIRYRLQRLSKPTTGPHLGTEPIMFWGAVGYDELRAAIVKKITKYQRPLIAITGVPTGGTPDFVALDEVMYGSEFVTFHRTSATTSVGRSGGLLIERGEAGALIRKHLVGVLGVRVEMPAGAVRHKVRMHLFHAQEDQHTLASAFLPVPQTVLRPNGDRLDLVPTGEPSWSMVPGDK
ncbi:MAG: hypothetical protein R2939_01875 [Kofleriaceae bacterium]